MNILNALTEAIKSEQRGQVYRPSSGHSEGSKKATLPSCPIRQQLEGWVLNPGGPVAPVPKYRRQLAGSTPGILREVGRRTPLSKEDRRRLEKLKAQFGLLWERYKKAGERRLHVEYQQALDEHGRRAAQTEEAGEPLTSLSELESRREQEIAVTKKAMLDVTLSARQTIHPYYAPAAAVAAELLTEELEADKVRGEKFGFPLVEPSALHHALFGTVCYLRELAKSPPPAEAAYFTTPPNWASSLWDL